MTALSTLPTEIEGAIKRLTGASEHALNAGTGRIEIACCDPNDLRLLLSRLSSPDPMLEEFTRLNAAWLAQQAKNRDLWTALVTITGHYDARSEIYTNDADLAEAMAGIARQAIKPGQATQ